MSYQKTISVFNGNGNRYTLEVPTIMIPKFGNDVAKRHFEKNTGLKLKEYFSYYLAKPKSFKQVYKIFVTYNFKTRFFNNASFKNTLKLEWNID